jgi:hypothetical protein
LKPPSWTSSPPRPLQKDEYQLEVSRADWGESSENHYPSWSELRQASESTIDVDGKTKKVSLPISFATTIFLGLLWITVNMAGL